MAEEVIPFSMVMVPFVIALGYDSISGGNGHLCGLANRECNFLDESV